MTGAASLSAICANLLVGPLASSLTPYLGDAALFQTNEEVPCLAILSPYGLPEGSERRIEILTNNFFLSPDGKDFYQLEKSSPYPHHPLTLETRSPDHVYLGAPRTRRPRSGDEGETIRVSLDRGVPRIFAYSDALIAGPLMRVEPPRASELLLGGAFHLLPLSFADEFVVEIGRHRYLAALFPKYRSQYPGVLPKVFVGPSGGMGEVQVHQVQVAWDGITIATDAGILWLSVGGNHSEAAFQPSGSRSIHPAKRLSVLQKSARSLGIKVS